jgi:glutathione S-transferase
MKLFKFVYSPYARKVQAVLDLSGVRYEALEVPYGNRAELVAVTGGYLQVPVLVTDSGTVLTDSRAICEHLVHGDVTPEAQLDGPGAPSAARRSERTRGGVAAALVPAPFEGPIWAYADFADGPLEDVLFRLASPQLADKKASPEERALYVYIKERKFGVGCIERWAAERQDLIARGRRLLAPSVSTLLQQPFLFGETPTLADAALFGNLAMLEAADETLPASVAATLPAFMQRFREACNQRSARV